MSDNELDKDLVVKYYLTTATDGKEYNVEYYSLQMIIAIGYRVRGVRGTYNDFNTRRKMLEAQKADEEDQTLFDDLDSLQSKFNNISRNEQSN